MTDEEKILEIKEELHDIDIQIVRLLNQRADFSTELNNLKIKLGMPVNDRTEDYDIMDALEKTAEYYNMITSIYPSILSYSRTLYED